MNKTATEAAELIDALIPAVKDADCEVVICTPFTSLVTAVEKCKGTNIHVGAENVHFEKSGAFTGEISADMLAVSYTHLPQCQEFRDYDPELGSGYNSQPEPVTVMDQWGKELVVCCAVQCFTYENEDGTFWATRNVYALISVEDYLAGRENYREFSSEE